MIEWIELNGTKDKEEFEELKSIPNKYKKMAVLLRRISKKYKKERCEQVEKFKKENAHIFQNIEELIGWIKPISRALEKNWYIGIRLSGEFKSEFESIQYARIMIYLLQTAIQGKEKSSDEVNSVNDLIFQMYVSLFTKCELWPQFETNFLEYVAQKKGKLSSYSKDESNHQTSDFENLGLDDRYKELEAFLSEDVSDILKTYIYWCDQYAFKSPTIFNLHNQAISIIQHVQYLNRKFNILSQYTELCEITETLIPKIQTYEKSCSNESDMSILNACMKIFKDNKKKAINFSGVQLSLSPSKVSETDVKTKLSDLQNINYSETSNDKKCQELNHILDVFHLMIQNNLLKQAKLFKKELQRWLDESVDLKHFSFYILNENIKFFFEYIDQLKEKSQNFKKAPRKYKIRLSQVEQSHINQIAQIWKNGYIPVQFEEKVNALFNKGVKFSNKQYFQKKLIERLSHQYKKTFKSSASSFRDIFYKVEGVGKLIHLERLNGDPQGLNWVSLCINLFEPFIFACSNEVSKQQFNRCILLLLEFPRMLEGFLGYIQDFLTHLNPENWEIIQCEVVVNYLEKCQILGDIFLKLGHLEYMMAYYSVVQDILELQVAMPNVFEGRVKKLVEDNSVFNQNIRPFTKNNALKQWWNLVDYYIEQKQSRRDLSRKKEQLSPIATMPVLNQKLKLFDLMFQSFNENPISRDTKEHLESWSKLLKKEKDKQPAHQILIHLLSTHQSQCSKELSSLVDTLSSLNLDKKETKRGRRKRNRKKKKAKEESALQGGVGTSSVDSQLVHHDRELEALRLEHQDAISHANKRNERLTQESEKLQKENKKLTNQCAHLNQLLENNARELQVLNCNYTQVNSALIESERNIAAIKVEMEKVKSKSTQTLDEKNQQVIKVKEQLQSISAQNTEYRQEIQQLKQKEKELIQSGKELEAQWKKKLGLLRNQLALSQQELNCYKIIPKAEKSQGDPLYLNRELPTRINLPSQVKAIMSQLPKSVIHGGFIRDVILRLRYSDIDMAMPSFDGLDDRLRQLKFNPVNNVSDLYYRDISIDGYPFRIDLKVYPKKTPFNEMIKGDFSLNFLACKENGIIIDPFDCHKSFQAPFIGLPKGYTIQNAIKGNPKIIFRGIFLANHTRKKIPVEYLKVFVHHVNDIYTLYSGEYLSLYTKLFNRDCFDQNLNYITRHLVLWLGFMPFLDCIESEDVLYHLKTFCLFKLKELNYHRNKISKIDLFVLFFSLPYICDFKSFDTSALKSQWENFFKKFKSSDVVSSKLIFNSLKEKQILGLREEYKRWIHLNNPVAIHPMYRVQQQNGRLSHSLQYGFRPELHRRSGVIEHQRTRVNY